LRWFGKKSGRLILRAALPLLTEDPLAENRDILLVQGEEFRAHESDTAE
jgi:hypothetical protein